MFTCLSPWLNSELFGGKGGIALICVFFQQVAHDLAHCAYQYMVVKMPSQQKKKTLVELFKQKKKTSLRNISMYKSEQTEAMNCEVY